MDKKELLQMRLQGMSYEAIAQKVGVSRQRVQQLLSPPPAIRNYVVNKYEGKCRNCGILVGNKGQIHHININGKENYEDIQNLELLCLSCHMQMHHPLNELPANRPICKCGNSMWRKETAFTRNHSPRQLWICGKCGKTKTTSIA